MTGTGRNSRIRVAMVAVPHSSASGLFGIRDTLSSVGVGWESCVTNEAADPHFEVSFVAATASPFLCGSGIEVHPDYSIRTAPEPDIVLVSGLTVSATDRIGDVDPVIFEWIAAQHAAGKQVVSACTGAILLAETGLLDDLEATTHWAYGDLFRTFYPRVLLRLEKNLCCSDPRHRIVTAGGTSAWQELALYLIARHVDVRNAVRTAKFWLIPCQGDLQTPYVAMPKGIPHNDRKIADCQSWIADNYAHAHPVACMTELSGLSRSTFRRRFQQATGYTAMEYVHAVRIEEAKQLLETTTEALDGIAETVGYDDEASFRKLFKRWTGITPSEHRRLFGFDRFRRFRDGSPEAGLRSSAG